MVDASKLQYYTGYNAYKNLGVHPGVIAVDTANVAPGTTRTWQTTISVEPNSRFAFSLIQANETTGLSVPTALRWQAFPPANIVYQTLSLDPAGNVSFGLNIDILINNNQVTFRANAFNPNIAAYAFNSIDIGFVYAVHTTDI